MKVVYSINAKFGGAGIGNTAYHAVSGIYRADSLEQLFVSSNAQHRVPLSRIRRWGIFGRGMKYLSAKEPSGLLEHFGNILFDAWVAAQVSHGDIFHGWNGLSLRSLQAAKQRGMVTIVERASSHPSTQVDLLRDEYARWGVPFRFPMWNYRRMLEEFEACDYITVPSQFARDSMMAHGVANDKLVEIPFGVDLHHFIPKPHSMCLFRIVFMGQISLRKGVPYLLEAWDQLGWNDSELWLAGSMTRDFASINDHWSNVPGVSLLGFCRDPASILQQSDLFVFPTIEEGSALVTYEAMACGLPVITTRNAGSIVRDGVDGFIIPIRDVNALCDRMQRMRDNATLRKEMSRAAREQVNHFSWSRYGDRLVEAYQRITHTVTS